MQQSGQLEKQSTRAFLRTLVTLVVPIALQNLINVAVQSADVIMLGRVNETVLSAGSLAGQVQFVLILIFFGLASGAAVLTAQYWGKGDTRTIEKVMTIALRLAMSVAILFFLAAMLIPATLMRIFTPDPEVIAYGVQYLRFIAPSYLLVAFTNTYLNIIRSVEIVIVSTIVYFISLIINIFLNAILIFGSLGFPAMGIRGAALATTLARVVEFCIVAAYAACNKVLRLRIKDFLSWNAQLFKDFMRYAMPTTLNEMLWGLAMSANAVIVGHLGSQAVAANSVAQVMRQLATVVSFGLASATAIMVGKAIGAGDELLARHNASRLLKISALAGVAGSGIILLARPFVASMMNLSPLADKYLRFLLIVMSIYVLCQAFTGCMIIGVLRGGGDTRFGLFLDTGTMWGFSIIFAALAAFVFHWPVKVVFAIIMCDELIKLPIAFARYKGGCWLRNVTR